MADGTACPEDENSTDCLLRELLKVINDKDNEFNWDPLTFGFLVPIGLVAALFAALTIFQAILSAGSGRRRCNKIAIGRWSKLTTRRWSWHDLIYLSTARTPLLRSESILRTLNVNKDAQASPGKKYLASDQSHNGASAATWLNFLQEINLEDLALSGKDENIAETAADYLPSDLIAVPAYGEVGLIVAMAAAVEAYSWKFNSQSPYPVIIGEDFQFNFRQHSTLGTVGAFSTYVQRVKKSSVSRKYLAKAIEHSRGEIDIATNLTLDEQVRKEFSPEEGPVSVNIIELSKFKLLLIGIHSEACKRNGDDLCGCSPLWFDRSDEHLLWLFIADTPEHPPAIFPSGLIHVPNLLSMLALNSKFWATESKAWRTEDPTEDMPAFFDGLLWIYPFVGNERLADHQDILGYVTIYQRCIQTIYEPQAFQAWFDSQGRYERLQFRQQVVLQLQQLDKWLQNRDREQGIRCSILNLYRVTNALLRAEHAIMNGSMGASVPADQAGAQPINHGGEYLGIVVNRHSKTLTALRELVRECCLRGYGTELHRAETVKHFKGHSKLLQALTGISPSFFGSEFNFHYIHVLLKTLRRLVEAWDNYKEEELSERSDTEIIEDVLIWRCILIHLLFSTAPDNSKILTSGTWEQVIPIL